MGLNVNWFESYDTYKMQVFPFPGFCDFVQKHSFGFFAFCVITFVPVKI